MMLRVGKHVFHESPSQASAPPVWRRSERIDPAVAFVEEAPGAGHRVTVMDHHPGGQARYRLGLPEVGGRDGFVTGLRRRSDGGADDPS